MTRRGRRNWARAGAVRAAALVALAATARAGASSGLVLYELKSGWYCDGFGASMTPVGDLNGDGVSDLLVGAPYHSTDPASPVYDYVGQAYLFSGADGTLLRVVENEQEGLDFFTFFNYFGTAVAALGDVTGDGFPDYAIGAPGESEHSQRGHVAVFSGATGERIQVIRGPWRGSRFGEALGVVEDLDGDGLDDLAVGQPDDFNILGDTAGAGQVQVCSSATWSPIQTLVGENVGSRFGSSFAVLRDPITGARTDLAIGAPNDGLGGAFQGSVYVYSAVDGMPRKKVPGPVFEVRDAFGYRVVEAGRVNDDAVPDIVVGSYQDPPGPTVHVLSGQDFSTIRTLPLEYDYIGKTAGVDDLDGDGLVEIAAGVFIDKTVVFSSRTGTELTILPGDVSVFSIPDADGDGMRDVATTQELDYFCPPIDDRRNVVTVYSAARIVEGGFLQTVLNAFDFEGTVGDAVLRLIALSKP